MIFFCPVCFKKLNKNRLICPYCHININKWQEEITYESRLIHALQHPLSEVRMGAIITLANMRSTNALIPLTNCAFKYPKDIIQNLEIIKSIEKIPSCKDKIVIIKKFKQHPSKIIKKYIFKK